MQKEELVPAVAARLGMVVKDANPGLELLIQKINDMILSDFDGLVAILYRMDVSEEKLNVLLKDNPGEDAGRIIAALMLEREWQRQQSKELFSKKDEDIPEEDKW